MNIGIESCKEIKKGELINPNSYDSSDIFSWDDKTDLEFWKKHIFDYA